MSLKYPHNPYKISPFIIIKNSKYSTIVEQAEILTLIFHQ